MYTARSMLFHAEHWTQPRNLHWKWDESAIYFGIPCLGVEQQWGRKLECWPWSASRPAYSWRPVFDAWTDAVRTYNLSWQELLSCELWQYQLLRTSIIYITPGISYQYFGSPCRLAVQKSLSQPIKMVYIYIPFCLQSSTIEKYFFFNRKTSSYNSLWIFDFVGKMHFRTKLFCNIFCS